jgi:hypothetical protein
VDSVTSNSGSLLPADALNSREKVAAFFKESNLPTSELIKKIANLSSERDQMVALTAFLSRFSLDALPKELLGDEFRTAQEEVGYPDPDELGRLVSAHLKACVTVDASQSAEIANAAKALAGGGIITPPQLSAILKLCNIDPFEKIDGLSVAAKAQDEWPQDLLPEVVAQMVESDPLKAMETISAKNSTMPPYAMRQGLGRWMRMDPEAAQQWFNSNRPRLNAMQQDRGAMAMVDTAVFHEDFESAVAWAEEIKDKEWQSRILNMVDGAKNRAEVKEAIPAE